MGGVVGIYDRHAYLDEKREALERWAARVAEIVGRPAAGARMWRLMRWPADHRGDRPHNPNCRFAVITLSLRDATETLGTLMSRTYLTPIAWAISSAILFTLGAVASKYLAKFHGIPAEQIGFLRSAGALLVVALNWQLICDLRRIRDPLWFGVRCGAGLLAGYCLIYAMTSDNHLALINLIITGRVLLMPLVSRLMLGERAGPATWAAMLVGFLGVAIAVYPRLALGFDLGVAAAIAGAALSAVSLAAVRRLTANHSAGLIVLVFMVVSTAGMAPLAHAVWVPIDLSGPWVWVAIVALGAMAAAAQISTAKALSAAPLPLVSFFDFLGLPLSAAVGLAVWGERLTDCQLVGCALVLASSAFLSVYLIVFDGRRAGGHEPVMT